MVSLLYPTTSRRARLRFQSSEEVACFEALLERYQQERKSGSFQWVSLADAYEFLQRSPEGGRVFAALLDLRFNVANLEQDLTFMGQTVNASFVASDLSCVSLLEAPELFFERLDLLKANTSYIFRYRAIFDKIMALLVLLSASPKDYDGFMCANSRRKSFKKIAAKTNRLSPALVKHIIEAAEKFDDRFRTAEVHGTGSARKWVFAESLGPENPQIDLFWAWNRLHPLLTMIGKQFVLPGKERA